MEPENRLWWREAAIPGALLVLGFFELAATRLDGWVYGVALEAVASVLLVWRRGSALVVAPAAMVVLLTMPWVGPQLDDAATPILYLIVSVYSLARWIPDLRGLLGVALVVGALAVDYVAVDDRAHDWTDVVFVLTLVVPPYIFGRVTRRLAEQAAVLEQHQELVRREAVRADRDRIARELHDVIAHSVSAMVVQTAAAQDLVRTDPDRADAVLEEVAAIGRRALVETGRLLHVIRDDKDELGLDPAPGVSQLPALVDAFRDSGLDVDLQLDPLPQLSPGLDVSVYRIVQEALTNALKHGADRSAALRVFATPSALAICASNPANGHGGGGSGLGLLGISERVGLLGGHVESRTDSGRFRLDVRLPLPVGER